jgi:hypothetical protein
MEKEERIEKDDPGIIMVNDRFLIVSTGNEARTAFLGTFTLTSQGPKL